MFEHKKIIISVLILMCAYLVDYFILHKEENTVLETKFGKLKGKVELSRDGRQFYAFLGIPYSEPPLGKLRFLSPKPAKSWTGIRDATKFQSKCMQVDMLTNVKGGNEDCLYLNVWSPKSTGVPSILPVVVYFNGENFMNGDSKMFGPKYIMDEDVVFVSVNYRLASLGFLNAGCKYARGNMGMKDQVQALKWVQQNIAMFSGDSSRVILLGHSAGGSSASLHTLSKMSSGLFHGVISSSGTALAPFALQNKPIEQAKRLAKKLRCPSNRKMEAMVACLGQAEVQRLVESHRETVYFLHDSIAKYGPTVEVVDDEEAFLTKDPSEMLKNGEIINKVPWIVGFTSNEGRSNAATVLRNSSMMKEFEANWENSLQKALVYKTEQSSVHRKIKEFYFGYTEEAFITRENENKLSKLFGDRMHVVPTHNSAIAHAKKAPVYLYHFTQPSTLSFADVIYNQNGILPPVVEIGAYLTFKWISRFFFTQPSTGVSHFDDQTFLFNIPFMPEYTEGDANYEFSKDLLKLWVSFAKDGKPSPFKGVSWTPMDPKESSPLKYLEISKNPKMIDEPFANSVQFWNSLNLR